MLKGTYRTRIDTEGRLSLPTPIRHRLREGGDTRMVVTLALDQGLNVYPSDEWESLLNRMRAEPKFEGEVTNIGRMMVDRGHECHVDHEGRLSLPAELRASAGLQVDVVITGSGSHLSIMSRQAWEQLLGAER